MTIELENAGTMTVSLNRPLVLKGTPVGDRYIIEVTGVELKSDKINASMKGSAAADWAVAGSDGSMLLDVRFLLETDDGELIYCYYQGRGDITNGPGSEPFISAPMFSTGSEKYGWLNKTQAIAKGIMQGPTLTYELAFVK